MSSSAPSSAAAPIARRSPPLKSETSGDDIKPAVEKGKAKRAAPEPEAKPVKKRKAIVVKSRETVVVAKKKAAPAARATGGSSASGSGTSAASNGGKSNIGQSFSPGEGQRDFTLSQPEPTRDPVTKVYRFADFPAFTPNVSPEEIIRQGSFGGGYFRVITSAKGKVCRDDWSDLPKEWYAGISVPKYLTSMNYDVKLNKWGVKCGQSYDAWEEAGWFELDHDARGWCQWYGRFWMGRRCADDSRQLDRWKKISTAASGRWRRMFYGKYVAKGIETISPTKEEVSKVIRSVLFTWGYEPNTPDLHLFMREKGVPITVPEE